MIESSWRTVDGWNAICIFNLSTLELDNSLQRLSFAGLVATYSARVSCGVATTFWNWLQFGYKFEMWEKEKSRKSLIYRTLSWALQDGLEPTTPWLTATNNWLLRLIVTKREMQWKRNLVVFQYLTKSHTNSDKIWKLVKSNKYEICCLKLATDFATEMLV